MDLQDWAQEREEEMRSDALEAQLRKGALKNQKSKLSCVECGTRIPKERRKALPGVDTCVDCQTDIEKRERR